MTAYKDRKNMPHPDLSPQAIWKVIFDTILRVAAVFIALGVIFGVGGTAAWPVLETYFEKREQAFSTRVDLLVEQQKIETAEIKLELVSLNNKLAELRSALPDTRPFIEVKTGGVLKHPGKVHQAGQDVEFLYSLRRNEDCPTRLRVQFYSGTANSIIPRYTYDMPSVRASASFGFQLFSVTIALPDGMAPGYYSYVPRLIPDRDACPTAADVVLEPSDFFEVGPAG